VRFSVSVEQKVRRHFDADARRFDAIYEDANKGPLARWVDSVWRGVVRRRLGLTVQLLTPLDGKTILDIGCGSGRFCVAYAEHGARVLGVDFAPQMIDLARRLARQRGVADRCEFRTGTFPQDVAEERFDACTAVGFFDYVADPAPLVRRMSEIAPLSVMSFPKAWEWRVPWRRLRFWLNGCPLFLYSEARVKEVLKEAGVTRYDWIVLDRDYVVAARS
jgi:2-polyprenyl-3-methyl-5-hydroxy-6-metoxy-1,4-benzoquinol methylase